MTHASTCPVVRRHHPWWFKRWCDCGADEKEETMTKRRITLVVDDAERERQGYWYLSTSDFEGTTASITKGVKVESIESIPEPVRVQEFRVRVTTKADCNPWTRHGLEQAIRRYGSSAVIVTEVDPT